jgi:hypothetical protein
LIHDLSFRQPSREELQPNFLWRSQKRLPGKGEISVFNRSYYEDVLVTRVHLDYLKKCNLARHADAVVTEPMSAHPIWYAETDTHNGRGARVHQVDWVDCTNGIANL